MLEPLPPSQQMVELTAGSGGGVERLVNGARVVPAGDGRFFWQLAAGDWSVRAVSREKFAEQKNCRRKRHQLASRLFARLSTENLVRLRQIPELRCAAE